MEPWQDREPWMPAVADAPVFDPITDANTKIATLRALGLLKAGEAPVVSHAWQCGQAWRYAQRCTCPGGPEILWPDHDELKPHRARGHIIERFVITH